MKMVANETELRNALKERAPEITIVTSYADIIDLPGYGTETASDDVTGLCAGVSAGAVLQLGR